MINGFITVRTASKRFPDKCLLPLGDINVLTHIIRRAKFFHIRPIVCTTDFIEDDRVVNIALREGVDFFRGSSVNKIKRWADCAEHFQIQSFHTIDADDPFFDPVEIIRSMATLEAGGFDMVMPTKTSSQGSATVGFSLTSEIVQRTLINFPVDTDTEMMWDFISQIDGIKMQELAESNGNSLRIRLTLDYPEDYWLISFIYRICGTYSMRELIDNIFKNNPDLYLMNWFRNDEWLDAQAKKINSHTTGKV